MKYEPKPPKNKQNFTVSIQPFNEEGRDYDEKMIEEINKLAVNAIHTSKIRCNSTELKLTFNNDGDNDVAIGLKHLLVKNSDKFKITIQQYSNSGNSVIHEIIAKSVVDVIWDGGDNYDGISPATVKLILSTEYPTYKVKQKPKVVCDSDKKQIVIYTGEENTTLTTDVQAAADLIYLHKVNPIKEMVTLAGLDYSSLDIFDIDQFILVNSKDGAFKFVNTANGLKPLSPKVTEHLKSVFDGTMQIPIQSIDGETFVAETTKITGDIEDYLLSLTKNENKQYLYYIMENYDGDGFTMRIGKAQVAQ